MMIPFAQPTEMLSKSPGSPELFYQAERVYQKALVTDDISNVS